MRWALLALLLSGLVVMLSAAWVAVQALRARSQFTHLQSDLRALESAALSGADSAAITGRADRVRSDADAVAAYTRGALWNAWAHAPLVGRDVRVVHQGARALDDIAAHALDPLASLATQVRTLRQGATIDVTRLRADAPDLNGADAVVQRAARSVAALPDPALGEVARLRAELVATVTRLSRQTHAVAVAATVGPAMLGADGPRHYFVAVQNDAEARATGGIVSAYALLSATRGRIHLDHVGSDSELPESPAPAISLGTEFQARYGAADAAGDWRNATMTPDAPTAARIMLALWARQHHGQRLDGVIAVDPAVMADILTATGPMPGPDRIMLTDSNVQRLTLVDYYRLYPTKAARSEAFTAAARAVFTAVQDGRGSLPTLVERLGHSAVTNHLTVYSTRTTEERTLATTAIAGRLPAEAEPFLQVVTQDAGGSKLSVYLRRAIDYEGQLSPQWTDLGDGRGAQPIEAATLRVTLRNTAPTGGLPSYVVMRDDVPGRRTQVPGTLRVYVSVYVARSGGLTGATLDGAPLPMQSQTELGMPVFSAPVELPPGSTRTLTLQLLQPTHPGASLVYRAQPLAVPERVHITQR